MDDLWYLAKRYHVTTAIENRTAGTSGELVSLAVSVVAEHKDTKITGRAYVSGNKDRYDELCAEAFFTAAARARRQAEALEAL